MFEQRPSPFEQAGCVMLRSLPLEYECEQIWLLPDDPFFVDVGPGPSAVAALYSTASYFISGIRSHCQQSPAELLGKCLHRVQINS